PLCPPSSGKTSPHSHLPARSATSVGSDSTSRMTPRPLRIKRVFPWAVVSTAIQSRSRRRWASLRADLTPRRATSLALVAVIVFITGCATPLPTRRDVVVGLVGEPRTVFDDDPS